MHLSFRQQTRWATYNSLSMPPISSYLPHQPTMPDIPQSKPQLQPGMDDMTSLHCRIAALETELHITRDQLTQSQNGASYLIGLLGNQPKQTAQADRTQEIKTLRAQLDDALLCNTRLERLLDASRRARSILETREEKRLNGELRVLERGEGIHGSDDAVVSDPVTISMGSGGEYDEDLLGSICEAERDQETSQVLDTTCGVSEKGVRDGWAAMQSKIDTKGKDEHVESAANGSPIGGSGTKTESPVTPKVVATAHSVHLRSYSMDAVKQYDISTPTLPVAPLQQSQWAPPQHPARRPTAEPRPYMRRQYPGNAGPEYRVTHLLGSRDPGLRRAVLVSKIPIGMTLAEVCSHLESDRILTSKFAGTAGMKTQPPIESNMAILEFMVHEDAQTFVDVYAKHAIFELELIATPTRPLPRPRVDSGFY